MNRCLGAFLLVGLIATAQNAVAAERGNLHLFPSAAWATPVPDEQLADQRGAGIAFFVNMNFAGMIDDPGNLQGSLNVVPGAGTTLGSPIVTTQGNNQTTIVATLGNVGPFSGLGQFIQVPGNGNNVTAMLTMNVVLVTVGSTAAIPSMSTLFR